MEVSTDQVKSPTKENFSYHESPKNTERHQIRLSSKRKLFQYCEDSTSDDEMKSTNKKVKIMKPPINYTQTISKAYQSKAYTECLDTIDEFFSLPAGESQYKVSDETRSHYKIIQAACWTMLDIKTTEAFETFNEIIRKEPRNSFAYYGLGLAQYRDGDLINSVKAFETAINFNPSAAMKRAMELKAKAKSIMDLIFNANEQFEMKNCSCAVEMLNAAARVDPNNKKLIKTIVRIREHFVKDLVERLEQDMIRKLTEKNSDVEKLIMSNQLAKAEKLIDEIGKKNSTDNGHLVYLKGLALYMKGSLQESLKLFKKAQQLDESLEKAKTMESKTLEFQELVNKTAEQMSVGKYEEAIETLTQTLTVDKNNRVINQAVYFQRALAYFNLGNFEGAFEDYKKFDLINQLVGNVLSGLSSDVKVERQKEEVPNQVEDMKTEENISAASIHEIQKEEYNIKKEVEEAS